MMSSHYCFMYRNKEFSINIKSGLWFLNIFTKHSWWIWEKYRYQELNMVFCQELTPSKPREDIENWFTMVKFQFKLNTAIQLQWTCCWKPQMAKTHDQGLMGKSGSE